MSLQRKPIGRRRRTKTMRNMVKNTFGEKFGEVSEKNALKSFMDVNEVRV